MSADIPAEAHIAALDLAVALLQLRLGAALKRCDALRIEAEQQADDLKHQDALITRLKRARTQLRDRHDAADAELARIDAALGLDAPGLTRSEGDRVEAILRLQGER